MARVEDLWSWGRLIKGVQRFYNDSRGETGMSEWFDENVGLKQGCVMSLWMVLGRLMQGF